MVAMLINGAAGISQASPVCVTTSNGIVTGTGTCQLGSEQWAVSNGLIYTGNPSLDFALRGVGSSNRVSQYIIHDVLVIRTTVLGQKSRTSKRKPPKLTYSIVVKTCSTSHRPPPVIGHPTKNQCTSASSINHGANNKTCRTSYGR